MNGEATQSRDQLAAIYLQQLQALASEMSSAIDAISSNELPKLQDSVANQEMLCVSLASMAKSVGIGFTSPDHGSLVSADSDVDLKIQATTRSICDLNLQYSALLMHSGRSIALLASLCRSHTGQTQEAHGIRLKHQTWSCEM